MLYTKDRQEKKITLLISTIGERIQRVPKMLLAPNDFVEYLVSWQKNEQMLSVPPALETRKDVCIVHCSQKGLSENRNNALKHSLNKNILLCDDDCSYTEEGLKEVIHSFEKYPDADILLFQSVNENGMLRKKFPETVFFYENRPKGYYASSMEIAISNKSGIPSFDKRFGLGSPFLACGEEEVFLNEAQKKKCKIIYIPIPIVQTNEKTTGSLFFENINVRHAKGAVYYVLYGKCRALFECFKYAFLHSPKGLSALKVFKDLYQGLKYIEEK